MDEQEDEAHHEPDYWEGVEDALEDGSQFSVLGSQFLVLGSQFSVLGSQFSGTVINSSSTS
jgi:hypothetical protein